MSEDILFFTSAKTTPGNEAEVQQALHDVAAAARTQPGCVEYSILRSADDPAVTINAERWTSVEERDEFLAGPDVKKFASAVSGSFAEPPQPRSYRVLDEA